MPPPAAPQEPTVDSLREQLRERGYLSHGIERWFALDPWSSRAFWLELATVAAKAALLIALFGALPIVAILLFRNHPLSALETLELTAVYGAAGFAAAFVFIVLIALVLKLRPELAIDTPRALLAISLGAAAVLSFAIGLWWVRFDSAPSLAEALCGFALVVLFFLMATIVVSAALLSFSIYELQRVPAIHQKPRAVPMTIAAAVLLALLFIPAYAGQEKTNDAEPLQVITTPSDRRIAFVAVDGLTSELFRSRSDLTRELPNIIESLTVAGGSTTERWATVGTGVSTRIHGVRAIEGVRMRGGRHLIQTLSRGDLVLHDFAPAIGMAERQALPPTIRRRDYVWELFAKRGVPVVAVNWWTSEDLRAGGLTSVSQESVFAAAARGAKVPPATTALRVDETAAHLFIAALDQQKPRIATIYLPALDVILNRLPLDATARLAASLRALDALTATVMAIRARGYDVILTGLPGDRQEGAAVIASTIPLRAPNAWPLDVAPTLCVLAGFPPSSEMSGHALTSTEPPRIASYGARGTSASNVKVNEEYYENLKSLGYIR
ncbi:MAG TPA: hypothetical protein VN605_13095 [Thermoanaerobaculia bacterium]|nr:hypothetical protein [Thermoanaerobaculia bacterium]